MRLPNIKMLLHWPSRMQIYGFVENRTFLEQFVSMGVRDHFSIVWRPIFCKSKENRYLVQKYGGRYFTKVRRIDILSRCMEADILESKKHLYVVQKYGG